MWTIKLTILKECQTLLAVEKQQTNRCPIYGGGPKSSIFHRMVHDFPLYPLVNVYKKLWNITISNGKTHYFNGQFQKTMDKNAPFVVDLPMIFIVILTHSWCELPRGTWVDPEEQILREIETLRTQEASDVALFTQNRDAKIVVGCKSRGTLDESFSFRDNYMQYVYIYIYSLAKACFYGG